MADFNFKSKRIVIIKSSSQAVIPNTQGVPIVVNNPSKTIEIPAGPFSTEDPELIERLRRDSQYNVDIMEISEEDKEVISIKRKKEKEADEEIKEAKRRKKG